MWNFHEDLRLRGIGCKVWQIRFTLFGYLGPCLLFDHLICLVLSGLLKLLVYLYQSFPICSFCFIKWLFDHKLLLIYRYTCVKESKSLLWIVELGSCLIPFGLNSTCLILGWVCLSYCLLSPINFISIPFILSDHLLGWWWVGYFLYKHIIEFRVMRQIENLFVFIDVISQFIFIDMAEYVWSQLLHNI